MVRGAAWIFVILLLPVLALQAGLAAGMPWGEYAMGGAFPGQFPTGMRIASGVQMVVLALFGAIVLARADAAFTGLRGMARFGIWIVVALMLLASVLNLITPSASERMLWAPVAIGLFVTSLTVALRSKPAATS